MNRKQMESDLYISIMWMIGRPDWQEDRRMILDAIQVMKQLKPIRLYKKRYKTINEYILDCMKYDIKTNKMDDFIEFVEDKEG